MTRLPRLLRLPRLVIGALLAACALPSAGCLDLDSFVFNAVHCSTVDASTCSPEDSEWDKVCVPCDEPYDWAREYPWMDETLAEGETIRPIDAATIVAERLTTDDGAGELDTYFIPSHGEDAELAGTTVIYNHGNYAGIEHYLPRVRMLHEAGFAVLVWDYRGYGKSDPESTPTPDEWFADAQQIRDYADTLAPDPDRILLYANSLGGIPALEQALYRPGCALMFEAGWTSLGRIAESNATVSLGEGFLSRARYDNVSKVVDYAGPFFVMSGDEDNKFPITDTHDLFDNAPTSDKELWVLPGVKHGIANGGVPEAGFANYVARMRGFMRTHAPACLE